MDRRKTIVGELVRTTDLEREEVAKRLKYVYETLLDLTNMVHEMNGPARLEIAEAVVETRTASGYEIPVPVAFFIGDIKSACHVLQERLKG